MTLVDVDLDTKAGLHVGPLLLKAVLGLQASLDKTLAHLEEERKRHVAAERAYAQGVHDIPVQATGTSAGAGDLFFTLGGPSAGRMWEVKSLVIAGTTWKATATGDGIVYRMPADVTKAGPTFAIVFASGSSGSSLPAFTTFGARQLVLHYPDRLSIHIAGPTATTQYIAGGTVLELPDEQPKVRAVTE